MAQITVQLPDDIAQRLGDRWKDLPRAALESLALEAYRAEMLTAYELRCLLGIQSGVDLDGFLKQHGIYLEYSPEELESEAETSRRLWELRQEEIQNEKRRAG